MKKIKGFPCPTCEKRFTTKSNMYRHMKLHVPGKTLNYKCHVCAKQFSSSSILKKHIKVHGNAKQYKCNICSGVFSHPSNLKKHMKIKHAGELGEVNSTSNVHIMNSVEPVSMASFKSMNGMTKNIDLNESNANQYINAMNTLNPVKPAIPVSLESTGNATTFTIPLNDINSFKQGSMNSANITNSVNTANADGKKKKKVCNICGKQFSTSGNLSRHKKIHYGDKPFHCAECNKQFMEKNDLKRHMKTHEVQKSKCANESKLDEVEQQSLLNSDVCSSEQKTMYACSICDKQFLYKSNYLTHMRIHSSQKPFKCTQCNSRFTQSSNLYRHMKLHKSGKTIKVRSPTKKNAFRASQALDSTEDEFTKESQTKILSNHNELCSCDICGKQFSTEGYLTRHMKIHLGEKPHSCNYCPRQFTQSNDLKKHLKVHLHEKTNGYVPYIDLNESADASFNLVSSSDKTSHKCDICSKELSTEGNLRRHMKLHTGERPFECEKCNRRFMLRDDLKRHMNTHLSGDQQMYCNNAEKDESKIEIQFNQNNGLPLFKETETTYTERGILATTQPNHEVQFLYSEDIETCMKTESDEELASMSWDTVHGNKDRDLKVVTSSQTAEKRFSGSNDLERVLNSQKQNMSDIYNRKEKQMKQMVLIKTELETDLNTQMEEPKVHIILPDDFEASIDGECMDTNRLEVISASPQILDTQIRQEDNSCNMPVVERMSFTRSINNPGMPVHSQLDVPEVHIIKNDDFNVFTDTNEPEMYFMQNNDLDQRVIERYYNQSESLLHAHVDEPVAISSEPHPIDDNVIQPIFVYKSNEFIHHDNEDIIVVNSSQVCNVCSEHFPTEDELQEHTKLHHNGDPHMYRGNGDSNMLKKHVCTICMKRFSTDGNLNRHMKIHTGEKPFQCECCGRQFTQSNDLKRHLKIHMRGEINGLNYPEELKQGDCNPTPDSMLSCDGPGVSEEGNIFICNTCGKRYSSHGNLKRHLKLHLGLKMSQYKVIDKYSYRNDDLSVEGSNKDIDDVNDSSAQTFQSVDDNPKHETKSFLHGINGKYFLCNICHKSYSSLGNLKRHLKLNHSGVKDSNCDDQLENPNHNSNVDNGSELFVDGLLRYKVIQKEVTHSTGDKTEIRSFADAPRSSNLSNKRFMCNICSKHYSTLKSLKRHLKLHVGLKISDYKVIEKPSQGNLTEAEQSTGSREYGEFGKVVHSESLLTADGNMKPNSQNLDITSCEKSYYCNVCSKQYTSLGNLKRHLKLNHNINNINNSQLKEFHSIHKSKASDLDANRSVNYTPYKGPDETVAVSDLTNLRTEVNLEEGLKVLEDRAIDNNLDRATNQVATLNSDIEKTMPVILQSSEISLNFSSNNLSTINNEKNTLCHICGKCYSNVGNLKRHLKLNHGIVNNSLNTDDKLSEDIEKCTSPATEISMGHVNYDKPWVDDTLTSTNVGIAVKSSTPVSSKIKKSFVCIVCSKRFSSSDSLKHHTKLHGGHNLKIDMLKSARTSSTVCDKSGKLPLSCNICGKGYLCQGNLKRHLKMNHCGANETARESNIDLSDMPSTEGNLESSFINTEVKPSNANDKHFICNVCSKPFSSVSKLKCHLRLHPGFKVCQYTMGNAGNDFEQSPLEPIKSRSTCSDVKSKHSDSSSDVKTVCNICGRQYSSIGNLKRHIKLNHTNNEGQCETICNICGKQYSSVGNLKRHIKLNHNDMENSPYKASCNICGREYSSTDNLRRHMKINHLDTIDSSHKDDGVTKCDNLNDYTNETEPVIFTNLEDITVTPETGPSSDVSKDSTPDVSGNLEPRSFVCSVCSKCYSTPGNLKRHMKLHLGLNMSQYKVVDRDTYPNNNLKVASFVEYEQSGSSLVDSIDADTSYVMDNNNCSEKKFACSICDKSYLCLGNLKRHLDLNHGGIEDLQSNEIDDEPLKEQADSGYNNLSNNDDSDSDSTVEYNHGNSNISLDNSECNNVDNSDSDNTVDGNYEDMKISNGIGECNIINGFKQEIIDGDTDTSMNKRDDVTDDLDISRGYNNISSDMDDNIVSNHKLGNERTDNIHNENSPDTRGGKAHVCTICGNQYISIGYLKRHMEKHAMDHKGSDLSNTSRDKYNSLVKHTCPMCNKEFSTGSNLSRHMKIHTGEKPYKCKHCYRYFTQSNDLKRHTKTHFLDPR